MTRAEQYYLYTHGLTLLCYFVLLACMFYGCWSFGPAGLAPKLVLWLLISGGLLLVAPGLIRKHKRSYIWLCYILLMYFVFCVQFLFAGGIPAEAGQPAVSPAAAHEVVAMTAIVVSFCTAILASRGCEQTS